MTVLTPVVWLTIARKIPTARSLRSQGVARTWRSPRACPSWVWAARWEATIWASSSATGPSTASLRTRLREPTASSRREWDRYQREVSGMRRIPIHRASAGIVHRTSIQRQAEPLPPETVSCSRKAW